MNDTVLKDVAKAMQDGHKQIIVDVAKSMKEKRFDLLDQPLDHIWTELAKVAIEAYICSKISIAKKEYANAQRQEDTKAENGLRRRLIRSLFRSSKREAKKRAAGGSGSYAGVNC